MTTKLYYEDLYLKEFDASVLEVLRKGGKYHILLDRTAFYPEGGGQPCDSGFLDGILVEQVYEEEGNIFHVAAEAPGEKLIHGQIDWQRRFDIMQQHLGQHILSAILLNEQGAETTGLRMSREAVSIDTGRQISTEQLKQAELRANEAIYDNLPVEVLYPSLEEIKMHSKRNIPQTDAPLRIIKIGELDYTPCCGTHNRFTGEAGIIKIWGSEVVKGNLRIHFSCGRQALAELQKQTAVLEELKKELSAKEQELPALVRKLREDFSTVKAEKQLLLNRTSKSDAEKLLKQAVRVNGIAVVSHVFEHTTGEELKQIYGYLTAEKNTAAILGGITGEGAMLLAGCNKEEKQIDIRPAFRAGLAVLEGKGGGSSTCAQGIGMKEAELSNAVETTLTEIRKELIMMKSLKKDYNVAVSGLTPGAKAEVEMIARRGSGKASDKTSDRRPYEDGHYHGAFFYPERK